MYCKNCGSKINGNEKFCSSCGHNLKPDLDARESAKSDAENKSAEKRPVDILWSKFVDIVKAEGDEAKKYKELSANATWEMIGRFQNNGLNNLLEDFKIDLDKQPYKLIEEIKNSLRIFALDAYYIFLAEALIKNSNLKKVEINDAEILAEEWKRIFLNYQNKIVIMSDDVTTALDSVNNQIGGSLFKNNPALNDLPKVVVDGIKKKLIQQLINGYLLGISENNIREKK